MSTSNLVREQKMIKGRNLKGDSRTYTFGLMPAKTGFHLFHDLCNKDFQVAAPMLVEHMAKLWSQPCELDADFDPENIPLAALQIVQYFPIVFNFDRLSELNSLMLTDASVTISEETVKFDKDGFARIDPMESYNALLYAIIANYEPFIPPLLWALQCQGDDDTKPSTDQKEPVQK